MRGDDDFDRRERRAALREMLSDPEGRAELRALLIETMRERGGMGMGMGGGQAGMGMGRAGDCPGNSAMRDDMRDTMRERFQGGAARTSDRGDDIREYILEQLRNDGQVRIIMERIRDRSADTDDDDDENDDGKL